MVVVGEKRNGLCTDSAAMNRLPKVDFDKRLRRNVLGGLRPFGSQQL